MFTSSNRMIATAVTCLSIGVCTLPAATAQAFDIGGTLGTVIAVGTQYSQLDQQLSYLDNQGRDKYLDQVKTQVGVNENPRANNMLASVMGRLSASVAQTDPSIKKKPYNYFVNNDTGFNAFCTLGHNMSVNIGLFNQLNYNEDELAFVVAHEMGHGQKGHPAEGIRKTFPVQVLASVVGNNSDAGALGAAIAAKVGSAKLITKPMEIEADKLAFGYAVGAGYNPGAGAALWQHVIDKNPSSTASSIATEPFNDHPGNISRRNTYNTDITTWSNGAVKVDANTGTIFLNGKTLYTPPATNTMSTKERAYLIAGNLSAVYHATKHPDTTVSIDENNAVYVGSQYIATAVSAADAQQLQAKLQQLL